MNDIKAEKNEKKNWFDITLTHMSFPIYKYKAMTQKLERNMVNMCGINITY